MEVTEITGVKFREMISAGSRILNENAEFVNSLNVFPVPDGDTGTNMSLSFESGQKYVEQSTATNVGILADDLAKGLLMGARGNSGVILSQIFRGFSKSVLGKEILNAKDLTQALSSGVKTAYKAVMKPTEGTVLTVARKAAEAAIKKSKETDDVISVMKDAYEEAKRTLQTTPELLPVLKEVGVVDSGGQGLVFVYQGFYESLAGLVVEIDSNRIKNTDEIINDKHHQSVQGKLSTEDIKYGYCTEIMVRLDSKGKQSFDYDKFRNWLAEKGDSLLVIADDDVVKVHVHTEKPGDVLSYGQRYGSLIKIKIDNMRLQHENILEKDESGENKENIEMSKKIAGQYGIVSVVSGNGIKELFEGLGSTVVIDGGQTMNPSTEDIVNAIKKTKKDKVIVLPNNKNIFMAANEAAKILSSEIEVCVILSKSVIQGMTGLLSFDKDKELNENQALMTQALSEVVSGQVTIAVRDTNIQGKEIRKDEYIGIIDDEIKVAGENIEDVTVDMIEDMLDSDSEVVTIIYGKDSSNSGAQKIKEAVLKLDEDLEVEIHEGDQPIYPYLVAVE